MIQIILFIAIIIVVFRIGFDIGVYWTIKKLFGEKSDVTLRRD